MLLRISEPDGNYFILPDNDIEYSASTDADIGSSFRGDSWDGIQYLQRCAAEGTVNGQSDVHLRFSSQFLNDVDCDPLDFTVQQWDVRVLWIFRM